MDNERTAVITIGDEEYTPSDTVLANSKKIINDTGMNEGSGYR